MKFYLVGGAVRDQLLNLPIKEKDWVVIGATPQNLNDLGYKKVGKDFPVFLHPETQDEYALARTERKSGQGYYGFVCDFNPEVTLEEDLERRDLTINAMAMDDKGQLIDPYGGYQDLQNRILRHVSPAFAEDPVRVLRVARFMARFHHLGFKIAEETLSLMNTMVKAGELNHLVPERVWQEWQKSLEDKNPECFIQTLRSCDALKIILPEFDALFGVPNPVQYHPEIDSGIHTLQVIRKSAELSSSPKIRFAASLHDLGKGVTPYQFWPSHHGHEETGVTLVKQLCQRLKVPNEYRNLAMQTARVHLLVHRLYELKATTIVKTIESLDAIRKPEQFRELLIACQADALAGDTGRIYTQTRDWMQIRDACVNLDIRGIVDNKELSGEQIKQKIHEKRVSQVKQLINQWKSYEK